jgi:hypothetical protein
VSRDAFPDEEKRKSNDNKPNESDQRQQFSRELKIKTLLSASRQFTSFYGAFNHCVSGGLRKSSGRDAAAWLGVPVQTFGEMDGVIVMGVTNKKGCRD